VYIPADVAHRLESDHVAEVTLRCEVELYGPARSFPSPIVQRVRRLRVVIGEPPYNL